MEIKLRAWNGKRYLDEADFIGINVNDSGNEIYSDREQIANDCDLEQFTGVKDCELNDFFIGDIGEFENGDRFVIKMEDFLCAYVEWIGSPKCEDQARDFYRISRAKKIGNINENKELMESTNE